jgi:hypothetical protein
LTLLTQSDRFPPSIAALRKVHSITSSAIESTSTGIVSPSALAVLRLITNSNLVDCSTGSSMGPERDDVELSGATREPSSEATIEQSRAEVSSLSVMGARSDDRSHELRHDGFPGRHASYELLSIPN